MEDEAAKRRERSPVRREQAMNPYRAMREMMEHMMLEDLFSDWSTMRARQLELPKQFTPIVDVIDEDRQIRVEAEIPGMSPEDLEVTVTEDRLILRGEKQEKEESGTRYRERSFGSFERVIALPCDIDRDSVQATFKNGVLHITIPKTHQSQPRKIRIQTELGQKQVSKGQRQGSG